MLLVPLTPFGELRIEPLKRREAFRRCAVQAQLARDVFLSCELSTWKAGGLKFRATLSPQWATLEYIGLLFVLQAHLHLLKPSSRQIEDIK